MSYNQNNYYLNIFKVLSFLGLFFLVLIYNYAPRIENPFKNVLVFIFLLICLLGILAALYPSKCLKLFKIETVQEYECQNKSLKNVGHHPDCGEFDDHIFMYHNKKYCLGCSGLITGAVMAILTCILYLIYGGIGTYFYLGVLLVLCSLLQMIFNIKIKLAKFLSNLALVWGSSLILVGFIDSSNVFLCVYFLFLIVVWIFTRTEISKRNHNLICKICEN